MSNEQESPQHLAHPKCIQHYSAHPIDNYNSIVVLKTTKRPWSGLGDELPQLHVLSRSVSNDLSSQDDHRPKEIPELMALVFSIHNNHKLAIFPKRQSL